MKVLFYISLNAVLNAQENVAITDFEKQKVDRLQRNWPLMLDTFFDQPAAQGLARRPTGAVRFSENMTKKIGKWHGKMVAKWHACGRASMDPTFERMRETRFEKKNPFKAFKQLTNQYITWIEHQIHNGCDKQAQNKHFINRMELYARILPYKYCKFVDNSNRKCSKNALNPRQD